MNTNDMTPESIKAARDLMFRMSSADLNELVEEGNEFAIAEFDRRSARKLAKKVLAPVKLSVPERNAEVATLAADVQYRELVEA